MSAWDGLLPHGEYYRVGRRWLCSSRSPASKLAIKKAIKKDIEDRVKAGDLPRPPTKAEIKEINRRIDKQALSVVVKAGRITSMVPLMVIKIRS